MEEGEYVASGLFLLEVGRRVEGGGPVAICLHYYVIGIVGFRVVTVSSHRPSEWDSDGAGMRIAPSFPARP